MDRLTIKHKNGYLFKKPTEGYIDAVADKLGQLEDLEEQGKLIALPCKVRDRFWELNKANEIPYIYPRIAHSLQHCVYVLERLGKTTFLTKEEAEQALAKMEEGAKNE